MITYTEHAFDWGIVSAMGRRQHVGRRGPSEQAHARLGEVGELPAVFCWSKFGAEAGEPAAAILARKDRERARDGGLFLWGIGTSIRPSLLALLDHDPDPVVAFTPMRSRPAARDTSMDDVVTWRCARDLRGQRFELPRNALVTSRRNSRQSHYALVCYRERSLLDEPSKSWIDVDSVRNFLTGSRVGSSQVTAVVRALRRNPANPNAYRVAFAAQLWSPYLVTLEEPLPLNGPTTAGQTQGDYSRASETPLVCTSAASL